MSQLTKQYGLRSYTDTSGVTAVARGTADGWGLGVNVSAAVDVDIFLARSSTFGPTEFAVLAALWAYHSTDHTSMPRTIASDLGITKGELDKAVAVVAADAGIDASVNAGQITWTRAPKVWTRQKLYVRVSVRELMALRSGIECRMLVLLRGLAVRQPKLTYVNKSGLNTIVPGDMNTWGGHCVDLGHGAKAICFDLPAASKAFAVRSGISLTSATASALAAVSPLVSRFDMSISHIAGALVISAQRVLAAAYDHREVSIGWQSAGKNGKTLAKSAILDGDFHGMPLTVDALRARKVAHYAAKAYGLSAGLTGFRNLWLALVGEMITGIKATPRNFPWSGTELTARIAATGATAAFEEFALLIASRSDQEGDDQPLFWRSSSSAEDLEADRLRRRLSARGDIRADIVAADPLSNRPITRTQWKILSARLLQGLIYQSATYSEIKATFRRMSSRYKVGAPFAAAKDNGYAARLAIRNAVEASARQAEFDKLAEEYADAA
jgi:hypothetical protein